MPPKIDMNRCQLLFTEALTAFNLHVNQVSVFVSPWVLVPYFRTLGLGLW